MKGDAGMEIKWTDSQLDAINVRDKTLLVCAAAGSGKTACLTKRIIDQLTNEGAEIDQMLIVTFTRAAAAELRQRIFSSLSNAMADESKKNHLSRQLIKISSAKICTIDSFYLDLVRTNFEKLDLSPSFRPADEAELNVLSRSVMEDTVDSFYETRQKEFSELAECFVNVRNTASLSEVFLSLYSNTESLPEGIGFIKESADKMLADSKLDLFEGHFGSHLKDEILLTAKYFYSIYVDICDEMKEDEKFSSNYLPAFLGDKDLLESLIKNLEHGTFAECYATVNSYKALGLKSISKYRTEDVEKFKALRDRFKKQLASIIKKAFTISPENIPKALEKTARLTNTVYELLLDFEKHITEEKKQRSICSFSDIRRYAMELLVTKEKTPTPLATELSQKYKYIYIDEYQDVDKVQDLIFRSIAGPTSRFMVGDIKQSIYSFRGADPSLFNSYREKFAAIEDGMIPSGNDASVFMSDNFRCDSTVVNFTNDVCSFFFSECAQSMKYSKKDDLIFSKVVEDRVCPEEPVSVYVLCPSEDLPEKDPDTESDEIDETAKEIEAKFIASKICELLKDGKKANGERILPHDIAVLFRTKAMGSCVKEALSKAGIDCSDSSDKEYFENPDVLLMLCLLNAIDNPQRDIYFTGLLRSPFFNFTLDELIAIKRPLGRAYSMFDALCIYEKENCDELSKKCRTFIDTLDKFRDAAVSLPTDKLIRYLYSTELFAANGLINADDSSNLMRLYEYARKFEGSSYKGLYNFIEYINRVIEQDTTLESRSGEISEGKVTLMTIHQSKGLEFPVCIVAGAGGMFNFQNAKESLVFESTVGIAMKIPDGSGYARLDTPMRQSLIGISKQGQTEEEMRILYVALTRAREKLIITASTRGKEASVRERAEHNRTYKCRYTVCNVHSYIDWILASADPDASSPYYSVSFIERDGIEATVAKRKTVSLSEKHAKSSDEVNELLRDRFSFRYPYTEATRLPAKISVSRLIPEKPDGESAELPIEMGDTEAKQKNKKSYNTQYQVPEILRSEIGGKKKPTPAERGTATHLFLQFCDFERTEKTGVPEELCRLIDRGFIPDNSASLVFEKELEAFFHSELFKEIKKAKRVIREQRFNILLPTSTLSTDPEFLKQTEGEELAVQGVIDLLIEDENGEMILCDYKTDRLTEEMAENDSLLKKEMYRRHGDQLSYYTKAVERLFERKCKKVLIYSTAAKKAIEIEQV